MSLKVLDCTLRDGGNCNQWHFTAAQVERIVSGLGESGVDFIEVGYRGGSGSNKAAGVGVTAHCPQGFLTSLPSAGDARLAVQAVPSVCPPRLLDDLTETSVKLVRVAAYPADFGEALAMIEHVKQINLEASLNLMSASYATAEQLGSMAAAAESAGADLFYIADSFGALTPDGTAQRIGAIVERTALPVGYHGHNNLGLAFANAVAAVRAGATWLDCSLCGMARGAGNLPTEQLVAAARRWPLLDLRAELTPILAAAEYVRTEILPEPMESGTAEIECGVFDLHFYYHPLIRAGAEESGIDRHLIAARLAARRPRGIDGGLVEAVIEELRPAQTSSSIRRSDSLGSKSSSTMR